MSHLNVYDTDAAWRLVHDVAAVSGDAPAVASLQHANACGVATGLDIETAYRRAHDCDPVSAFGGQTAGIGAGQQSRVDAARIAVSKAGDRALGGVAASDAFFPFRDGLDVLAAAGIRAVIQPGGSVRDDEVVAAADEHGMALVLTGRRHFRH